MRELLTNRRGHFYYMILGITMAAVGLLSYILLHAMFVGTTSGEGLFGFAETQLNVTSYSAYQTVKTTWHLIPIAIMISGILLAIFGSERVEPETYYQ